MDKKPKRHSWTQTRNFFNPPLKVTEIKELNDEEKQEVRNLVSIELTKQGVPMEESTKK